MRRSGVRRYSVRTSAKAKKVHGHLHHSAGKCVGSQLTETGAARGRGGKNHRGPTNMPHHWLMQTKGVKKRTAYQRRGVRFPQAKRKVRKWGSPPMSGAVSNTGFNAIQSVQSFAGIYRPASPGTEKEIEMYSTWWSGL